MKEQAEMLEAIGNMIDAVKDAQEAAQRLPGNNWPLRKKLLEAADAAIKCKGEALRAVAS